VPPQASCSGQPGGHLAQTVLQTAEGRPFERVPMRSHADCEITLAFRHPAAGSGPGGSMRAPP